MTFLYWDRALPKSIQTVRIRTEDAPIHIIREYVGIEKRTLLVFLGLVVGMFVVITCLYSLIFGFDTLATNMKNAGSMMVSNFNAPVTEATGVPAAATQYSCPSCGSVGLPLWSPEGIPTCPACGTEMSSGGQSRLR